VSSQDQPLQVSSAIVARGEYFGALLFDKRTLAVIEVNRPTARLLSLVDGMQTAPSLADIVSTQSGIDAGKAAECVQRLLDLEILEPSQGKPTPMLRLDPSSRSLEESLSAPLGVSIEVTNRCNLRCRYCFQGPPVKGDVLSQEEVLSLLNDLSDMRVFTVFFGGGEPLLCPHLKVVAEYARDLGLEVGVSSNGTLLNAEIAEWFATSGLDRGLQISLDGSTADVHDRLRGSGSFSRTMAGIRLLASMGVHPSIAVTVTNTNILDVPNLVALGIAEGVRHVHVMCPLPSGNARVGYESMQPSLSAWRELQEKLSAISEQVKGQMTLDWGNWCYEPPSPSFSEEDYTSVDKAFAGCPAGKTKAVIGCFGDVYGCDVVKREDMVAGNIRNEPFAQIWQTSPVIAAWRRRTADSIRGKCARCEWLFACVGGCPAMSLHHGLGIFDSDPACPQHAGE